MSAFRATSAAVVDIMIAAGAKTEMRNSMEHGGALDIAASTGVADIVRALLRSGADPTPVPFSVLVRGPGAKVARSTTTYLAQAVQGDHADVLRVLHRGRQARTSTLAHPMPSRSPYSTTRSRAALSSAS